MTSFEERKIFEDRHRLMDVEKVPRQHPVRIFYDFFMSRRSPDGYLHRANFDPADIVKILPWMQILEEIDTDVFTHRVVGTAIVELLGRDNTGKLFGDGISAKSKQTRTEEFRMAFATREPVLSCSSSMQEERNFIEVIRGVFPGKMGEVRLIYLPLAPTEKRLII